MRRPVFIFDIDSTLANNDHRAALLKKTCIQCLAPAPQEYHAPCPVCGCTDHAISQSSWDEFLRTDLIEKDEPIAKGVAVVERLRELGAEIHFLTGRNRKNCETVTKNWLRKNVGWDESKELLCMREDEDRDLPASVYKERAFKRLIEAENMNDCLFFFFEDDPHVFGMYSKYGVVVRCPEGWDHFLPESARGPEAAWRR